MTAPATLIAEGWALNLAVAGNLAHWFMPSRNAPEHARSACGLWAELKHVAAATKALRCTHCQLELAEVRQAQARAARRGKA